MDRVQRAKNWGRWLQTQLDSLGWTRADLVRRSDGHISRARLSKWINGEETPSMQKATITANILGADLTTALAAAGYALLPEEQAQLATARPLEHYSDAELLRELERRLAAARK